MTKSTALSFITSKKIMNSDIRLLNADNYPLNYIMIAKMFDDIQGFIVLWGMPEEKKLKDHVP